MPLITCPDCGSSVSNAAHSCPSCGYPISSYGIQRLGHEVVTIQQTGKKLKSRLAVTLTFVVLAFIIFVFSLSSENITAIVISTMFLMIAAIAVIVAKAQIWWQHG